MTSRLFFLHQPDPNLKKESVTNSNLKKESVHGYQDPNSVHGYQDPNSVSNKNVFIKRWKQGLGQLVK